MVFFIIPISTDIIISDFFQYFKPESYNFSLTHIKVKSNMHKTIFSQISNNCLHF